MEETTSNVLLEPLIFTIRGHRVVLDADLARLYGVHTKRFSNAQVVDPLRHNWSQFATSSQRGLRYLPWAFTEHGALMAANILRSERAVQMSVFVVRAFVRLREQVAANTAVMARLAEIDKTLLQHDASLRDLYRKLLPLLQPPPDPPKRRIGFHTDNK